MNWSRCPKRLAFLAALDPVHACLVEFFWCGKTSHCASLGVRHAPCHLAQTMPARIFSLARARLPRPAAIHRPGHAMAHRPGPTYLRRYFSMYHNFELNFELSPGILAKSWALGTVGALVGRHTGSGDVFPVAYGATIGAWLGFAGLNGLAAVYLVTSPVIVAYSMYPWICRVCGVNQTCLNSPVKPHDQSASTAAETASSAETASAS